jgi:hypothetical protein
MNGKPPDPIKEPERFAQWVSDAYLMICKTMEKVQKFLDDLPCDDRQKEISRNRIAIVALIVAAGAWGIKIGFFG